MKNYEEIYHLYSSVDNKEKIWIYPEGFYSDLIMLNSVLNVFSRIYPERKLKVIKRSEYSFFFIGNPAIDEIGFPKSENTILRMDYWNREDYLASNLKPYQYFAKMLSLDIPIPEETILNINRNNTDLGVLKIPWKKHNILIAPFTNSPYFKLHPYRWHNIVDSFLDEKSFIIQIGSANHIHIKGAYSFLGLSDINTVLGLMSQIDLVITEENHLVEIANFFKKPAIIVLGPNSETVQTYDRQHIVKLEIKDSNNCLDYKKLNSHVLTSFSSEFRHLDYCSNTIDINQVFDLGISLLN